MSPSQTWLDGTRHRLLSSIGLLEKLAALVPPPRFHFLATTGSWPPTSKCQANP